MVLGGVMVGDIRGERIIRRFGSIEGRGEGWRLGIEGIRWGVRRRGGMGMSQIVGKSAREYLS